MGDIIGPAELGRMLGLKPETVRQYSTKRPASLPPRVGWSKHPRWDTDAVQIWMQQQAGIKETPVPTGEPKKRVGRPRKNQ